MAEIEFDGKVYETTAAIEKGGHYAANCTGCAFDAIDPYDEKCPIKNTPERHICIISPLIWKLK